ncbi:MAG: nucleoside recognition domain-containing protein, partial [Clostridia bacterium]|nr:nucleoside recognition domain-containing protein [Clostridia bacterium]
AEAVSSDSDPRADFERLERLCSRCISMDPNRRMLDREASDRLLMKRWVSLPVMALFLILIFWITLVGANYPSQWLSNGLFALGKQLDRWFALWNAPDWLRGALLDGVYRTLAWVVSVMLPPMAIFFPLFTLLEDAGFLPRIAFALDHRFSCCQACGKQALTTCMGFGCNAAGVVGCRIIESKRERMIAILTNAMIPCNGRFPALISILSVLMLMIGIKQVNGLITALLLSVVIVFAISVMFAASWLLGHTLLDGVSSSYVLEIPPYRRPQIGKVLVRSLLDRTLSILGRAAAIAAPCGLLLWLFANIRIGSESMLHIATAGLDPVARIFGLDGTILLSFLLGSPANEIVLPISYMIYQGNSVLLEPTGTEALFSLFLSHGWTLNTAVCFIVFTVLHWPCATTVWTIRKETKSAFYTILAIVLPTFFGLSICGLLTLVGRIIGLS